jgi:ADP-heptose:LPS heptosyltransferase
VNDPRTLRRLDRWLGAPLCFLASLGLRLAASLRRPRTPPAGRVLYVALAEMGGIVLAAPAIRAAASARGTLPVFVTLAQTRAVFDFLGDEFAADVHVLRTDGVATLCADLWTFARAMRRRGVAVAVDLDPGARFSALLALLSGAARRAGFAGPALPYRGRLYSEAVDCPPDRHMSANFAALVRAAAPYAETSAADTHAHAAHGAPSSLAGARLRRRLPEAARRRIVLLHANCSDAVPQRRWPRQRWIELCRRLLAEAPDLGLLFIGGPAEASAAEALCDEIGDARCVSVAGSAAIAELPALFALATLLVSSDSGPAHFAAHAGLPVVALFGPETPLRYRPLGDTITLYAGLPCSPCLSPRSQRASRCRDARCMRAIEVDAVLDALRARLRTPRRQRARA